MVTVHRAHGYRFVIFANDHGPAHVHVIGHGGEARISLEGPLMESMIGFSRADARRIFQEVVTHRAMLLAQWRDLHG